MIQLSLLHFFCVTIHSKKAQFLNVLCIHKTAKRSKFSVSYDTSLDVFLFHSTTCMKFCSKNLATDFSQQVIWLSWTCWVWLMLNRKTFLSKDQKSRKQDRQAWCFMQVKYFCLKQGSYNYPKAPSQQECSCYS